MTVESVIVIVVNGVMLPLSAWILVQLVQLKVSVAVIQSQIARIVSDAESEKVTRSETNKKITNELDEIKNKLGTR